MNKIILSGRLTKDPDYQESKMPIASFDLAVGRNKDVTDFFRIKAFNETAKAVDKFTAKGLRVIVEGRIQTSSYERKDGTKSYSIEVLADRVEFIDYKDDKAEKFKASEEVEEVKYDSVMNGIDLPF